MSDAILISTESVLNCLPSAVSPWNIYTDSCVKHVKLLIKSATRHSDNHTDILIRMSLTGSTEDEFDSIVLLCFLLKYRNRVKKHKNTDAMIKKLVEFVYSIFHKLVYVTSDLLDKIDSIDHMPDLINFFESSMLTEDEIIAAQAMV